MYPINNNKDKLDLALKQSDKSILKELRDDTLKTSQKKQDSTKRFLCHQLQDYCDNSNLHAIKYLGDSSRTIIERLCWAVAILVSLATISVLIFRVWDRWVTSPVIVSFAPSPTPIWQIPFPTVTICPQVKYIKSWINWQDMEARRQYLSESELKLASDLQVVCNPRYKKDYSSYPNFTDQTTVDNIVKFAPRMWDIIYCTFQYYNTCGLAMESVVTRDGLCFSFNSLPNQTIYSKNTVQRGKTSLFGEMLFWSLEGGYIPTASVTSPPLRASGTGFQMALYVTLRTDHVNMDFQCREVQGFKIALNNPAEVPRMYEKFFFIPTSGLTQLIVHPKVMQTSDSLRSYTPDKRQCYFSSDRELKYFTTYTQSNCEVECLTDFTLRKCGCVEFYMPRNISTPICGYGKRSCTDKAEEELTEETIRDTVKITINENACNCLPECQSIQYVAEISQGTIELSDITKARNGTPNVFKDVDVNAMYVFFKDSEFYASQRNELYGYADFMANCGGLLGLCCGFSILSLVELIYYFTLRLWVNYRRMKKGDIQK